MATQDDYIKTALRLPRTLHSDITKVAEQKGRSLNAELIDRLQQSLANGGMRDVAEIRKLQLIAEYVRWCEKNALDPLSSYQRFAKAYSELRELDWVNRAGTLSFGDSVYDAFAEIDPKYLGELYLIWIATRANRFPELIDTQSFEHFEKYSFGRGLRDSPENEKVLAVMKWLDWAKAHKRDPTDALNDFCAAYAEAGKGVDNGIKIIPGIVVVNPQHLFDLYSSWVLARPFEGYPVAERETRQYLESAYKERGARIKELSMLMAALLSMLPDKVNSSDKGLLMMVRHYVEGVLADSELGEFTTPFQAIKDELDRRVHDMPEPGTRSDEERFAPGA